MISQTHLFYRITVTACKSFSRACSSSYNAPRTRCKSRFHKRPLVSNDTIFASIPPILTSKASKDRHGKKAVSRVKIGNISANFQSKTLIPKRKNQISKKILTAFITSSYENRQSKIQAFFDTNTQIAPIIETRLFAECQKPQNYVICLLSSDLCLLSSDFGHFAGEWEIKVIIEIPDWLERLIAKPILLYRRIRFGYPFRRIPLTQGKYAIVDPDDFYWLSRHKWTTSKVCNKFYAVRTELCRKTGKRKTIRMHREVAHTPEGLECDHINSNSLDNRKANLRSATRQQNCWNSRKRKPKSLSKYKGVSRNERGQPWKAQLIVDGKRIYLGCFDKKKQAARAYDKAARKYYGDFAALNFPM